MLIAVIKAPIVTFNATVIKSLLTKDVQRFQMSPFLVFTLKMHRLQIYAFSLSFSKSPVFIAEQCERKAKAEKFYSVFI